MKKSVALAVIEHHVMLALTRLPDPNLQEKVINAAAEIGIPNIEAHVQCPGSWDELYYGTVLNQSRFCKRVPEVFRDVGYIKHGRFYFNPFAFTDQRLDQFLEALSEKDIDAQQHQKFGLVTYRNEDCEADNWLWQQREKKAFYR